MIGSAFLVCSPPMKIQKEIVLRIKHSIDSEKSVYGVAF